MKQWHKWHPIIDFWVKGAKKQLKGIALGWVPSTGLCSLILLIYGSCLKSKDQLLELPVTMSSGDHQDKQAHSGQVEEHPKNWAHSIRCHLHSCTYGTLTRDSRVILRMEINSLELPPIQCHTLLKRPLAKQLIRASKTELHLLK